MGDASGRLESRWLRVGGGEMHARASVGPPRSSSPTVVLVHGLVISSLYMVPTAERLAPYFPVWAPDLPGFGLSHRPRRVLDVPELADALLAWLDAAGLERVAMVGNSLGCQVIVDLAARFPGRVERAVLAGPTMDPAGSGAAQFGRWLRDWTMEPPSLAAAHLRDYRRAGLRRAWRTFCHALEDPVRDKLPLVRAPTLVVRGSRDPIVPQRWAEDVAGLLPRGRLAVIPGGPHVVNYTTPAAFTEVVRAFLQGTP
ncbi:MAG TPA: alpha/beta hydrolase [Longimicrobiaceae bacterium]|nr:alpha/beta hydrolase [Longimicrobiaceae bacterium]